MSTVTRWSWRPEVIIAAVARPDPGLMLGGGGPYWEVAVQLASSAV
jgi:hypothetical protein